MHKNNFWLFFLLCIAVIVIWFTGKTAYHLYQYYSLSNHTPAKNLEFAINEISEEQYLVSVSYSFVAKGVDVKGKFIFPEKFWNAFAANKAINEYSIKSWIVWYSPDDLNFSSLQKNFPLKECLSTGALWALLLYFLWLGIYVAKYRV